MTKEEAIKERVATQVTEDMDNFIFTTIKPWCEEKEQRKISKRDLEQALTQYFSKEPCDDAIDRAEAMTEIMMFAGNVKPDEEDIYIKVSDAVQLLRELPSVTQKSGKWIVHQKPHDIRYLECSCCNVWFLNDHLVRNSYCPNCGAKMESEDKE